MPLLPDFLVKKDTVRGTIGKIQGIRKAANPPIRPAIKIPHRDLDSSGAAVAATALAAVVS